MEETTKNKITKVVSSAIIVVYIILPGVALSYSMDDSGVFLRALPTVVGVLVGGGALVYIGWPRGLMDGRQRSAIAKLVGTVFIMFYGLPLGVMLAVAWGEANLVYGIGVGVATLALAAGFLVLMWLPRGGNC